VRRSPNPWIAIPSLILGLLAGALGWVVTVVSCGQPDSAGRISSCNGWAFAIAVIAFVAVTVGVGLVLVLVYRSLAEWREKTK
jgi:hypothetical protein